MPFNLLNRKSSKNKNKMPISLFRSQSEQAKKRLQHQLYLAQENPEPHFDISACQISEIPSSVFSLCRVLNKEVLLLYDNWIHSLDSSGKLTDLVSLRVLDLHKNELKVLPDSISNLYNLQVLNLEENQLKTLPDSIGNLINLQTLNVKYNKLKQLPKSIHKLCRLRTLDISHNEITVLSPTLCQVRTLETLILDAHNMKSPSAEICEEGTEEIMRTLCKECGLVYQAPSTFVLDVLEPPQPINTSTSNHSLKVNAEDLKLMESVEQYQSQMEKKQKEWIALERKMNDDQEALADLVNKSASSKKHLVDSLAKDQEKMMQELVEISGRREADRMKLLTEIVTIEKATDDLIYQLVNINESAKKTERLLEAVEKERREKDDWFVVRWEEIQNLRKKEVLDAMEFMIRESGQFEISRQHFTSDREHTARQILKEETNLTNHQVENILTSKVEGQKVLLDTLSQQEQLQRHAFEQLQLQKDRKNQRLTSQIMLIEEQLAELSKIERERRDLRQETELNILSEKRIALCALLSQLMEEQEKRQTELRKRLIEMEEQRLDGQADYWMVQYQRLMDSKPERLLDLERNLEIAVVKILQKAGAEDYLPLFARNRITIETMLQLTEEDLKQMGVHEMGLRKSIKNYIDDYINTTKTKKVELTDENEIKQGGAAHAQPSAPVEELPTLEESLTSLKRQSSITARGINSECAICLDKESQILFLNCGHICCCSNCAAPLEECPLCRGVIKQKIRLHLATA